MKTGEEQGFRVASKESHDGNEASRCRPLREDLEAAREGREPSAG